MTRTEILDVCTGCGGEAFVCVVGNGNLDDDFNGPYPLCQEAFEQWLDIGDEVVWIHD